MSYTPPAGGAVNFLWAGGSYAPVAGQADFSWNTGPAATFTLASGFKSTAFGVPATSIIASGFSAGAFGAPQALAVITCAATGQPPLSAFGAPTTHLLLPASGFTKTAFGAAASTNPGPVGAVGFSSTELGVPTVHASVTAGAIGFLAAEAGTPVAQQIYRATSLEPATSVPTPAATTTAAGTTAQASGFISGARGVPVLRITQHVPPTTGAATWLTRSITSDSFGGEGIASDFGAYSWTVLDGSQAGGLFGDMAAHGWGELELSGLTAATSGYYTVTAVAIAVARPYVDSNNLLEIEIRSAAQTLTLQHYRNGYASNNDTANVYNGANYVEAISTRTSYGAGSSHTIRFDVTPTQTQVTVDDVLLLTAPVAQTITSPTGLYIGARGLRLDSLSILDAQAVWGGEPADGSISTFFGAAQATQAFPARTLGAVTRFGAPFSPSHQTAQASGFATTRFGSALALKFTPAATGRVCQAFGFRSTRFGTPSAGWLQTGYTSGATTTAFGEPRLIRAQQANGFVVAQFGIPSHRLTQRASGFTGASLGVPLLLYSASGLKSTSLGTPRAMLRQTASGFRAGNTGIHSSAFTLQAAATAETRFGQPTTRRDDTFAAQGFQSAGLGTPLCRVSYRTDGFSLTAFGALSAKLTQSTSGFRATAFGAPAAILIQQADSTHRPVRFGLPAVSRSNTFMASGLNAAARLGHPASSCQFNYAATGFASSTAGAPTCTQRHRAGPASPETRFGKPLLRRITTC